MRAACGCKRRSRSAKSGASRGSRTGLRDHRFLAGVGDRARTPAARHALQHLVARGAGALGVTVRPQQRWRLRQRGEEGCLGLAQTLRALAQVGAARRFDAFEDTAHRRQAEMNLEDLALRAAQLDLQCAHDLPQLAGRRARYRFEQASHLHGQRRTAGDDAAVLQPEHAGAQECPRIDARVPPEGTVLEADQRFDIARRDVLEGAPDGARCAAGPGTRAAACRRARRRPALAAPGALAVAAGRSGRRTAAAPATPPAPASRGGSLPAAVAFGAALAGDQQDFLPAGETVDLRLVHVFGVGRW
jgi:hypothetical protein